MIESPTKSAFFFFKKCFFFLQKVLFLLFFFFENCCARTEPFFYFVAEMDIRPNHTIYINNLNEKIKKDGECKMCVCGARAPCKRSNLSRHPSSQVTF